MNVATVRTSFAAAIVRRTAGSNTVSILPVIMTLVLLSGTVSTCGALFPMGFHPSAKHVAPPIVYYVATNGNDAWSGAQASHTAGSLRGPLASIQEAGDRIYKVEKSGLLGSRDATVWVEGGTYRQRSPLSLTGLGSTSTRVVIAAYRGQRVVIDGGQAVTGWRAVTDAATLERLDPTARSHVYEVSLKEQGITDFGQLTGRGFARPQTPAGLELFFNDMPMTLARWPNTGWATIASAPGGQNGNSIGYTGERPARWTSDPDVWLHGYWAFDWADTYEKVSRIDAVHHEIVLDEPQGAFGYVPQHRWYAVNILEELDSPGEWYLDRQSGILSFWPPGDIRTGHAEVSMQTSLATIDNASNLTVRGLTFEDCRGTAVSITNSSRTVLDSCVFRDIGVSAVTITNSFYSGVSYSEISGTGDGGVVLSDGDRQTLRAAHCFVSDCRIHDYSRWDRTYRPAVEIYGVGNSVTHNLIYNAPHQAISLSGNDNEIAFNDIHDVCRETADAGAFYMGRDWTERGNSVCFNYFHDIGGYSAVAGFSDVVGVYLDDTVCGTVVYGNLFVRSGHGVLLGGGRDISITNNIFVNCKPAVSVDARGVTWAAKYVAPGGGWRIQEEMAAVPWNKPPYSTRYPNLKNVLTVHYAAPWNDIVSRNIMYGCMDALQVDQEVGAGLTHENNLIDVDPKFVNAAHGNFSLRPGSLAFRFGFQQLPSASIGPRDRTAEKMVRHAKVALHIR